MERSEATVDSGATGGDSGATGGDSGAAAVTGLAAVSGAAGDAGDAAVAGPAGFAGAAGVAGMMGIGSDFFIRGHPCVYLVYMFFYNLILNMIPVIVNSFDSMMASP